MTLDFSKLEEMSLDELWALHERLCGLLSVRIIAERHELERRLAQLHQGKSVRKNPAEFGDNSTSIRKRKKYPRVYPKYQNPAAPSETWSGRGKKPLWLVSALKGGKRIEDFQIAGKAKDGNRPQR